MHNKTKNIVIIGSGLGGLSCGAILAKNGYHITVLEQGTQIGGCLQCFTRRGVKFETGMHFIGSAAPGQSVNALLHYLEVDNRLHLSKLDPNGFDVVRIQDDVYPFASGRENFINTLCKQFPDERNSLYKYCDLIENIAKGSAIHSLRYGTSDDALLTEYNLRSVNEVLQRITSNVRLAQVLAGTQMLYAGEKDKTPFSTHAFIRDTYAQSAYRIVGGSDNLAHALKATIERYGGKVITQAKVTHIKTKERKVLGVDINNKEEFLAADILISDIHPLRTIELTDSGVFRAAYVKRMQSLQQTVGCFSVYLHFKDETLPYMNHNEYVYSRPNVWGAEKYTDKTWPENFLYMHFCHEENPDYARSGVVLTYMRMDEVAQWKDTSSDNRPKSYLRFKKEHTEKLLDQLEKHFPGTRETLLHTYSSTPLTYNRYTGTEGGSMYGICKDVHLAQARRVPVRTRIDGLMQTGQNVLMHGMFGVLIGSIITCSEIIPPQQMFNNIHET